MSGFFLKVPVVWAFAPPTIIEYRMRASENVGLFARCADLGDLLREGNGVTEYRIFYNETWDSDREAAEHISDCPGVRLFPQPGEGHGVAPEMARLGRLAGVIADFEGV